MTPSVPEALPGDYWPTEAIKDLVDSTREHVHVRAEDNLLVLRPNKVHFLNHTAVAMLTALYRGDSCDPDAVLDTFAARYGVERRALEGDLGRLMTTLLRLLRDDTSGPAASFSSFGTHPIAYPVLSEIALTYRCQNRCRFCYASSPERGRRREEMTTEEVCRVIDAIVDDAKVPSISFTGGEPTLRKDLAALVRHARGRGMRVNLITNGRRLADPARVDELREAGLHSAQVSLEAPDAALHDEIVGVQGAFAETVAAIGHLAAAGIHTHTNTTLSGANHHVAADIVSFVHDALGMERLSMNMVIRTGSSLDEDRGFMLSYSTIGDVLEPALERATSLGVLLYWYSPTPYCLFNPLEAGLGNKGCSAADGLLSIAPDGEVLPCSSFEEGLGSLLERPFSEVWGSMRAKYWRGKRFSPPACKGCPHELACHAACPLYWDEAGSFEEIACHQPRRVGRLRDAAWRLDRRLVGRCSGVTTISEEKR